MNKKLTVVVFVAMFLLLGSFLSTSYAYEQGKGKRCQQGKGQHQKSLDEKILYKAHLYLENKEELGLTDEQATAIKDLKLKVKKSLVMMKAEIEVAALDVKAALYKDSIGADAVNALIDKKYELKKAKAKSLVSAYAELKSILTKKQKDKLKEIYKELKAKKEKSHY